MHLCDPYEEGQTPNNAKNNSLLKERYLFNKRNEKVRLFLALPIICAKNCSSTLHASSEDFVVHFVSSVFFFVNFDHQNQALLTELSPQLQMWLNIFLIL